jgi:hypothetical protein
MWGTTVTAALDRPVLRGVTIPRIWTPPLVKGRPGPCKCGCALTPRTTHGFRAVEFAHDVLGVRLFGWQRFLLIHALELAPWGGFRFRTIVILVSRQSGKTTAVEVKNLFKMFVLHAPLVLGTAQSLDVSEESWDNAVAMVEGIPELYEEVAEPKDGRGIVRVNGKKTLRLKSGSRWQVASASRRGGRGKSGDDVNFDELREHHNWDSWSAVSKTTMAKARAQIWAFSNAGDIRSVVLNSLQATGRAAAADPANADPTIGHFEWSAPDDFRCTCARAEGQQHKRSCRLWDRSAWAQSNPSLGYPDGVTELAIENAMMTDPVAQLLTEVFCVKVTTLAPEWDVITQREWEDRLDIASAPRDPVVFAADVNYEGSAGSIGIAGLRADGLEHVEAPEDLTRTGTSWMVAKLVELRDKHRPLAVGIDPVGKAGALIAPLTEHGFQVVSSGERAKPGKTPLVKLTTREVTQAFDQFVASARDARTLRHRGDKLLVAALAGAATRKVGDSGAEFWARKDSTVNIAPLVAVTLARWVLRVRLQSRSQTPAKPVTEPASTSAGGWETADLLDVGF